MMIEKSQTIEPNGIASIPDHGNTLSFVNAVYAALRRLGYPKLEAYLMVRPTLGGKTAARYATMAERSVATIVESLTLAQALSILGDWIPARLSLSDDPAISLAAAKEINKLAGRYETQASVSDLATLLSGLASTPNQAPIKAQSTDADFVDTLAETVDLRRPGDK